MKREMRWNRTYGHMIRGHGQVDLSTSLDVGHSIVQIVSCFLRSPCSFTVLYCDDDDNSLNSRARTCVFVTFDTSLLPSMRQSCRYRSQSEEDRYVARLSRRHSDRRTDGNCIQLETAQKDGGWPCSTCHIGRDVIAERKRFAKGSARRV